MIASFGAAAIGMFSSLPLTFAGGLVIGVFGSLSLKYETSLPWLSGIDAALPFIVLFIVLICTPPSRLRVKRVVQPRPLARNYYAPWQARLGLAAVVTGIFAAIPFLLPTDVALWGTGLVYVVLFLSLGLLVKESGQVNLAQPAFAAVGAVAFAHAAAQWGLPWFVALPCSGFIAAAVGTAVAIPAVRVSGVFLALATLGFGLALQSLVYPTSIMFTQSLDGLPNIPRPSIATSERAFYFLLLVAAVATALVMLSIRSGRLGRLMSGLAESPLALNTLGTSANATRVIVFAISAFFAGIAGALYGSFFQAIGLDTPLFQPALALQLFAVVMVAAGGMPWYAVFGALSLAVLPAYVTRWFPVVNVTAWVSLVFGAWACFVAVRAHRLPTAPTWLRMLCERLRTPPPPTPRVEPRAEPRGEALQLEGISVRFGRVVAVDHLGLRARFGQVTGLIGPNGAGKTSTFNVCSGLLRPTTGRVLYNGRDITHRSPAARARLGIGRTFQQPELWDGLTVQENVALGCEAPLAGRSYLAQVWAPARERQRVQAAAAEAMALTGVTRLGGLRAGDLSTGQRRLVELARALAGPFDMLLLDEPSSGLDREETVQFAAVLRRVVAERGAGIVLVEHDVGLVMAVCQYVYVMDFGQKIFEGPPSAVASSDLVRAAYLGSREVQAQAGIQDIARATGQTFHETPVGEW